MQIVAIYPGRFHPFHKGHAASFKQLAQKFGLDNTYLAISAKQEQPKSPFSAQDRAKMAMSLGIPSKNIIAVRNPYAAQEYIDQLNLDPEHTAIVFGVSKKDMEGEPALGIPPDPRFSFKAKKDGSPSYLQPFNPKKVDPMSQHGYVMSTDVAEFPIAGKSMRDASSIRKAYAGADDKTKMRILKDLYGDAAEKMKQVFDNNLQITENIRRLILQIKPMLSEATVQQKAKFVQLLSEAKKSMLNEGILDRFKKKPTRDEFMRQKLAQMSTEELRQQLADYKSRIPSAKAAGSLVGGAVSDYANAIKRELDKRAFNDFAQKNPNWNKGMNEAAGDVYSKGQAAIIDDLGNGYFLGDDSYDDDEGFSKAGYSVYKQVGDNSYRMVGSVNMSPYRNEPGTIEREIERLISQDQAVSEAEEKSGVEQAYNDPDTHAILSYARQHYPEEPDLQSAFVKFVLHSLKHSKEDDERQDVEINYVQGKLKRLEKEIADTQVTETQDYLDEK